VLPDRIILTGGRDAEKIVLNWLSDSSLKMYNFGSAPFLSHYLNNRHYAEARSTRNLSNTYLMLESAFCEKIV